jgi:dTDP-4-amino-4,6-dideoxygalactose transaminase
MATINNKKEIRLSKSCLSDREKQAVMGVLDREFLGMGNEVQQFEKDLTSFFGRQALCVATGTAALQLALQAAEIGMGDEVLVQSLTYVASFQAISATGAKPIACDIDPEVFSLDWKDAETRLTSKTKAIMPVHYSGGVGFLDEIYEFANKHGLRVIEDAAHAFGTKYHGKKVGGFGDISCFSFDGIKNITSGEGGCIVTDDEEVLRKVRNARLLGVEKDTEKRYAGERSWNFDVEFQGWRFHMSNIMAAIGIEQLKRFSKTAKIRQSLAIQYDKLLLGHSTIIPLKRDYISVVPHIYVVRILKPLDRKNIQMKLLEQGIQTGIHYQPNHKLSLYRNVSSQPLSFTEQVHSELLTLPLHPELTFSDVEFICMNLKHFVNN